LIRLKRIRKPIAIFKTSPKPERKLITQKKIKKEMLKDKTPKNISQIIYIVDIINPAM
jgi:hypothetical protein